MKLHTIIYDKNLDWTFNVIRRKYFMFSGTVNCMAIVLYLFIFVTISKDSLPKFVVLLLCVLETTRIVLAIVLTR